jgi:predicted nucleic acid-binding protein
MKVFIDSSVIVEYIKGNKTDFLEQLIASNHGLFSNAIVYSEFMFYYLAVIGEKSPLSIRESKQIRTIIEKHNPIDIFLNFEILPVNNETTVLSYQFMQKYNLLPNDALIIATAKLNGIEYMATFDVTDFGTPCKREKIKLIGSIQELE